MPASKPELQAALQGTAATLQLQLQLTKGQLDKLTHVDAGLGQEGPWAGLLL